MSGHSKPKHPLFAAFEEHVHIAVLRRIGAGNDDLEEYVVDLLCRFLRTDGVFALRSEDGRRISSVIEMAAQGDIRLEADSFEQERRVHRHIGDYILFWSGIYPDFLNRLRLDGGLDLLCDYTHRAKESYYLVSTFDHPPHSDAAPVFRRLSEQFVPLSAALADVRVSIPLSVA